MHRLLLTECGFGQADKCLHCAKFMTDGKKVAHTLVFCGSDMTKYRILVYTRQKLQYAFLCVCVPVCKKLVKMSNRAA